MGHVYCSRLTTLILGTPIEFGPIEMWPLSHRNPMEQAALGDVAQLFVDEAPEPDPGSLWVENGGDAPVFLPIGSVFGGLQQSRMLVEDVYVGPGEGFEIRVACVEAGRFSDRQASRTAGRAPLSVVVAGMPGAGRPQDRWRRQSQVWEAVSRQEGRSGTRPTHSLEQVMQEDLMGPTTQRRLAERIDEGFDPSKDQVGAVLAVAGKPLLLEVFRSPSLARELLADLLVGVAFDVDLTGALPATQDCIKHFIREACRTPLDATGSGDETYRVCGTTDAMSVHGTWLNPSECLHLLAINVRHPLLQGAAV